MLNFTPLLGAQSSSPASQSLLELDGGIKILVDLGWDSTFDGSKLQELEKHVSTLSIVLLTHPTIEHLGAYAHCCKHVPGFRRVPVYATTPVVNLGRTLSADIYGGNSAIAASIIPQESIFSSPVATALGGSPNLLLPHPTADEIASYFSIINPLKYSQPHQPIPSPFSPSLTGLTITAYSAGHTLGGTIWHIQHGLESIVYASDWNLAKEDLFPGAAWLSSSSSILEPLQKPTALICSSRGVEESSANYMNKDERNDTLVSLIRETIAQGGKVLVPSDSSARVLELAFLLNKTWRDNIDGPHAEIYKNARIYMASRSSVATVRYLQSMLEWMDDTVTRNAEAAITNKNEGRGTGGVANPLDWHHVRQVERRGQLERALRRSKPCIMLASDASLEWGLSRQALEALANDSKNLVILTERKEPADGIGRQLREYFDGTQGRMSEHNGAKVVNADGLNIQFQNVETESLNAEENSLYQQYLVRQRQMHSTFQGDSTISDPTATGMDDDQESDSSSDEDEDEDTEQQGRALNLSSQLNAQSKRNKTGQTDAELGINVLLKRGKNAVHDYDVRNKRGRERMFPFVAQKSRDDEFGEIIKAEEYLRAEEKDDGDALDNNARNGDTGGVGIKRKWDDATGSAGPNGRPSSKKGENFKKVKIAEQPPKKEREPDAIDALIAKATGEDSAPGDVNMNGATEGDNSESDESDYEPEDDSPGSSDPQKVVFNTQSLTLNLRIAHVDFSGLFRKPDLQGLIGRINPRKMIITAGSEEETAELAEVCRTAENGAAIQSGEVLTPKVGATVDASVDTNAWTVKLSKDLVRRLVWDKVPGGLDIVAVTGLLGLEAPSEEAEEEGEAKKKLKLLKGQEAPTSSATSEAALPRLDLLPAQYATSHGQQRAAQPVHVGDLRLTEIREAAQQQGHLAEFRGGGTLLIDGTVVVRKNPTTGGIEVEAGNQGLGLPDWRTMDGRGRPDSSGTFYAVKRVIYERLAVVAGA